MTTDDLAGFGLRVDTHEGVRRLRGPAGTTAVTAKELALLQHLGQGRGQVVTRPYLLSALWRTRRGGAARALDVHIATLRAKLHATCGPGGVRIETVRGTGYRLLPAGSSPTEPPAAGEHRPLP